MGACLITNGFFGPLKLFKDEIERANWFIVERSKVTELAEIVSRYLNEDTPVEEWSGLAGQLLASGIDSKVLDDDYAGSSEPFFDPDHDRLVSEFIDWWLRKEPFPRDMNIYELPDGNCFMVAGEMSWGDSPQGLGYKRMEYLMRTGTFLRLGLR